MDVQDYDHLCIFCIFEILFFWIPSESNKDRNTLLMWEPVDNGMYILVPAYSFFDETN